MGALGIDTLHYSRRLEAAGLPRAMAEALAEEQARLVDQTLVTHAELARSETALRTELALLRTEMEGRFDATRREMLLLPGSIVSAGVILLGALLKLGGSR